MYTIELQESERCYGQFNSIDSTEETLKRFGYTQVVKFLWILKDEQETVIAAVRIIPLILPEQIMDLLMK
ncbi:MAG: hypothetical protein V4473_00485 [Patescibacteria group bacterium]